ncbi:MAG: hypothetical protein ACYDDS_18425 [Candidatus Sulfotelmatobacter sp.]|jgi:hypothetical protein
MHRLLLVAAVLLLAASVPLAAQRGGGHGSFGGGHGSFGGHGGMAAHGGSFGGHAAGGRGFSGARSSSGFAGRASARGSSFRRSFDRRGFNHFRDRDRDFRFRNFRNNCFGYGYGCGFGYPYLGGGIDPYWWWDSGSYDQDQQNQIDMANQMNAQSLDEQRMREQDRQGDQDFYARSAPQPARPADARPTPATVLVFRDQHHLDVQNYAIVGQTLWNFAPQHTQKIPLSDLDLPATASANEERGVDFHVPGAHEGQ